MGQGNTKSGVIVWGTTGDDKPQTVRVLEGLRALSVVSISAKGSYAGAVADTGELWMWGRGDAGQLGLGLGEVVVPVPRPIRSLQGKTVRLVACGEHHCASVTDSGALFTWGRGQSGRLGHGSIESEHAPRLVEALVGWVVTNVSCGDFHTIATNGAKVWSFGLGLSGRLGLGSEEDRLVPEPVLLPNKEVLSVAAGGHHSAILLAPGVLYTFGGGSFGKLGHGDVANSLVPKLVTSLSHVRLCAVSLASHHSAALALSGEVFVWGQSQGSGCEDLLVPTRPLEFSQAAAAIACGKSAVFVLTDAGDMLGRGPVSPELVATTCGFSLISKTLQQTYLLAGKGVGTLAIGERFGIGMADASRGAVESAAPIAPSVMEAPQIAPSRSSLLHVLETVVRASPPPPARPSMEGELIFLSSQLKAAQAANSQLGQKLTETQTRIAHLERENVSLREELDASLQCLPVGGAENVLPKLT